MPAPANLPQGWYRDGRASIFIGAAAEPIDAQQAPGQRLLFHIDTGLYPALIKARGYRWSINGPQGTVSGTVSFSGDIGKAIAELRACVKANKAAAPPRPAAASTSKWSGAWNWTRPMMIFGKPHYIKGLSIELLQGNRVRFCADLSNPAACKVVPFSERGGLFTLSPHGSDFYEVRLVNDTLNGQMWWKKEDRTRTTPDGTFVLRRQ